ncbi:MAG: protein-export chaperone SecB [Alphaproteobacteria bacterium]
MSETETKNNETENKQSLAINAQFIKDLSFEAPNSPFIFNEMTKMPDVNINVDVQAAKIENNIFGVDLKFHINGRVGEKTAFIVELTYGCVVTLNIPQEHMEPMLLIEVPRHLFPFARNILADVTRDGGFPPLMITPIDFVGLYRKRVEEKIKADQNQKLN